MAYASSHVVGPVARSHGFQVSNQRRLPRSPNSLGLLVLAVALAGCGGGNSGSNSMQVAGCTSPSPTIVCTKQGQVQGTIENGLLAFRGIPFAAPPVGDLRWRPPAPPASWQGVRSAASFGQQCIQTNYAGGFAGSEDCLTLNVYSANPTPNPKQPVMVFVHGGGWVVGNAQGPPYQDAPPLAGRGVVVVTVQYRLGLMGFFAHSKLTAEGGGSSGNYALMDNIAALRWVHDNIASFGGDPDRVMMFGESAGSVSVQILLVAPLAQGLFSRAGMESSALGGVTMKGGLPAAYSLYAQLSPLLGCNTASDELACLRAAPASSIIDLQLNSKRFPVIYPNLEPIVIPVDPFDALKAHGSPVPLLIGSNSEEAAALGEDNMVPPLTETAYEGEIHAQFDRLLPGSGTQLLAFYPGAAYTNPRYAHVDVETDWEVTFWTRDAARVAAGPNKVWRYLFTHRYEKDPFLMSMRAFHGAELFFVFGNLSKIYYNATPYTPSSDEVTLSNLTMDYWTRFAGTGDPNGGGATPWLPYDATHDNILQLDVQMTTINGYHNDKCDYMDTVPLMPVD